VGSIPIRLRHFFVIDKEPPMWTIVRRAVVPAALVIGGVASLIYGAIYHSAPVFEEQETKTTIEIPTGLPPPGSFGTVPLPNGGAPFGGPPLFFEKKVVTRIDLVTVVESEPELMREVSVGGIALLDSGELKRTYSGGKGPALCPS
jgi:hypothetical protein